MAGTFPALSCRLHDGIRAFYPVSLRPRNMCGVTVGEAGWQVAGGKLQVPPSPPPGIMPPAAPLRGHDRMALVKCGGVAGYSMPFFRVPRALYVPSPPPGAVRHPPPSRGRVSGIGDTMNSLCPRRCVPNAARGREATNAAGAAYARGRMKDPEPVSEPHEAASVFLATFYRSEVAPFHTGRVQNHRRGAISSAAIPQ